jgi:hypothetical protein
MMREGIQTEFKYVQFTTTKTGDEKSALLAPPALGVGEPHTHAILLKKKKKYIDWSILILKLLTHL